MSRGAQEQRYLLKAFNAALFMTPLYGEFSSFLCERNRDMLRMRR